MNAPDRIPPTEIDRSLFLGGSDAAAVIGVSPWATPVELWMQKTRRAPRETPTEARQRMFDRGHKLEPFIRDMVIDKLRDMGLQVELVACNERYVDAEFSFMSCEIDFELRLWGVIEIGGREVTFTGERINADAKSVSGFARKKWGEVDTEDVPIEYAAQFMFGLMVTGRDYCLVAALRSFDDVDIFWTLRDDETIDAMRPKLADFWINHVQADVEPDPIRFDDIKALFPLDNGQAVEATPEIAAKVERLRSVKAQITNLEASEEILKFEIAEAISPHSILKFEGVELMSWKGQNDTRLNTEAFKAAHPDLFAKFSRTKVIRVLRFIKPKKGSSR